MPETTGSTHTATAILDAFNGYRTRFDQITRSCAVLFEQGDWLGMQTAGTQRLELYKQAHAKLARRLTAWQPLDWPSVKRAYTQLIQTHHNAELAETFFNSAHRQATDDKGVNDTEMFVTARVTPTPIADDELYKVYHARDDVVPLVRQILEDRGYSRSWRSIDRDIGNILRSLVEDRPEITQTQGLRIEVLNETFYRNKAAYVVGKLIFEGRTWPIALPVLLDDAGRLYVDTLISDEDELSVVFSFTRAYFMVRTPSASMLVDFLHDLLPNKKRSELYASIGLHKHGKTEFYRGFLEHLADSDDQFIIAEGIKGMVMSVFTLPSYQVVFKIIKDRFAPQKNITHDEVREKYTIVKRHDRVGRMADTQEFTNFVFPRDRFAPELVDELLAVAPSAIGLDAATVTIRHLYTERLMTPLNLFIERASDAEVAEALDEYGNAIKQLAAANIFPGDMLLKNFGITRHGRVVFYDYDEICYLTEVNFRNVPEPQTPEQEMAAEPWYSVAANDVFPEEFRRFLFGRSDIKRRFSTMHGELFDPAYWRSLQEAIARGRVMDVFPYRRKRRFSRQQTG